MNNRQKGVSDNLFLIAIVALLIFSWIGIGTQKKSQTSTVGLNPFSVPMPVYSGTSGGGTQTTYNSNGGSTVSGPKSPMRGLVTIESGNASSEYEPFQEYITLVGSGDIKSPINITGWYLTNGKGSRVYTVGNTITHFASDVAIIPKAVSVFSPNGGGVTVPVMLGQYGRVTVVTGSISYQGAPLPSFRENECIGYLTSDRNKPINLYPNTFIGCPYPTKELGATSLENDCAQFIQNMSSCHTPNFTDSVVVDNVPQPGFVDGVGGLSSSCRNYLATHYTYQSCVAKHATDANFFTGNWRVYLNRPFEMWAAQNETITLYDSNGGIVNQYSY